MATISLICLLILNEVYLSLFSKKMNIYTYIDNSNLDERIRINLNISLLHVPCNALSLDIQDVTGAHLEDVKHTLHKLRLDQK